MFAQPIPVSAGPGIGTLPRTATHAGRSRIDGSPQARPTPPPVVSPSPRRSGRPRRSLRIFNVLAVVVAAVFVASLIGLAGFAPSHGDLTLHGPAVISGVVGMLTAVAGLAVGYAKAVQVAENNQ